MKNNFVYGSTEKISLSNECFLVTIPGGIFSKESLLQTLSSACSFPSYFGNNWDALLNCLKDLSWINEKRVVLFHNDLPLIQSPESCRVYLETLNEAIISWQEDQSCGVLHTLDVFFPQSRRLLIDELTR